MEIVRLAPLNNLRIFSDLTTIHVSNNSDPFNPTSEQSNIAITVIVSVFLVVGSTGNVITMLVIIKNKTLHNPSNFFIFSLSISDLISGVICSPLWLYRRTYGFQMWWWGEGLCEYPFRYFALRVSTFFQYFLLY